MEKNSMIENSIQGVSNANIAYIFVNPFDRFDSGINSYVLYSKEIFETKGIYPIVINKYSEESLEKFRERLVEEIIEIKKISARVIIEAPETDAVTLKVPSNLAEIHIRLHCSRQLGAWIQGQIIDEKLRNEEQLEILRAHHISAPSYSALLVSRSIFKIPSNTCCYPNPAPIWEKNKNLLNDKSYVLFVGRLHKLKGVYWVIELAKNMPDINFLMLCSDDVGKKLEKIPKNIKIINGNSVKKIDLYRNARAVIIPSIYETASMVGIEAISMGIPVVSWGHLGISEYANDPIVISVPPFDINLFISKLRYALKNFKNIKKIDTSSDINRRFYDGVQKMINGSYVSNMPACVDEKVVDEFLKKIINGEVNMTDRFQRSFLDRGIRKIRKLYRDPSAFFRDFWLYRWIFPPGIGYGKIPKKISNSENNSNKLSLLPDQFVFIKSSGYIKFSSPPDSPIGLISAFLHPVNSRNLAKDIIDGLSGFNDFRYVCPPMLQVGSFDDISESSQAEIINRIDLKNKNVVSSIDHLILLDPPPKLVEALRNCGTRQRLIIILSSRESLLPNSLYTDVLIVTKTCEDMSSGKSWRRRIVVEDKEDFPLAIRRSIQEGALKSPDLLLPLMGFQGNYRDELQLINNKYFQGLIKISGPINFSQVPSNSLYVSIAQSTNDLAVSETVYLRYKSLCDQIERPDVRADFLSFSLYDGVIFDVRS